MEKTVTMTDGTGEFTLRLSYDGRCVLDRLTVGGREVAGNSGVFSGVRIGGQWLMTQSGIATPQVQADADTVTVQGIAFGKDEYTVREMWEFTVLPEGISWRIVRHYPSSVMLDDSAMPQWNFKDMATWKGGILGNGGVVWCKYLESPNMTYGAHTGAVRFWNPETKDGLRIVPKLQSGMFEAIRFSHQGHGEFSSTYTVSDQELKTRHAHYRFLRDRGDLWAPFLATKGTLSAEFAISAFDYGAESAGDDFKGLEGQSIRELMNTVSRYGVIDTKLTGANGWRTGYICLHEPFFAQIALALNDSNYTTNLASSLDFARDHAIGKDGRVKARWTYAPWDAMPGSFGPEGFYEAQWGYLLDSQPDYVINVAELFDLTADLEWLRGQKKACESALEYLMKREVGNSGLVAMMTDDTSEAKGSDWIDIVWASYENAFVNAKLYYALTVWSEAEEALGDPAKAREYRDFAERLKTSFNKPIADGGFWNSDSRWYVYWRDRDGSIHGDNLVTPVNFFAIAYGICDDPERIKVILDRIESEMQKEGLFHWPLCFFPFDDGEGGDGNYPFPRYENGDIFLPWGEVAIRAYASYNPAIAVEYVKKVLARYEQDGLSFQRYLRGSQEGIGDDILAGNCMTVVGLFRDIYGIQPKPDRLLLDPRLTAELDGTTLRYKLRGEDHTLELGMKESAVTAGNCTVRSPTPFAVAGVENGIQYFPREGRDWELAVDRADRASLKVSIDSWPEDPSGVRRWSESSPPSDEVVRYIVRGLNPNTAYELKGAAGGTLALKADASGTLRFSADRGPRAFELRPSASDKESSNRL